MRYEKFALIHLEGPGTFIFQFFPKEIQTSRRSLWEQQEITIGTKPILYANREAKQIQVDELWLDSTETNQSIAPDIAALYALQDENPKLGRPPALLAIWGDRQERCVLEQVTVVESFFTPTGEPLRARVSLQLLELQVEMEAVSSQVIDVTEIPVQDIDAPLGP